MKEKLEYIRIIYLYANNINFWQVVIVDNGIPQLSSTTRVVITVEDINDHAPDFEQKFFKVQIPSNAVVDQALFQVCCAFGECPIKFYYTISVTFGASIGGTGIDGEPWTSVGWWTMSVHAPSHTLRSVRFLRHSHSIPCCLHKCRRLQIHGRQQLFTL